jgi:hypothetical protein
MKSAPLFLLGVLLLVGAVAPAAGEVPLGAPAVRTDDGFSGPASFDDAEMASRTESAIEYCSEVCGSSVSCGRQCWSDPETKVNCGYVGNCSTACANLCEAGIACSTPCVGENGQGNITCQASGYPCGCVPNWQVTIGSIVEVTIMTATLDWDNNRTYCAAWKLRKYKRVDTTPCPDSNDEYTCIWGGDGTWLEGWAAGIMTESGCCASAGYTWGTNCFPPTGSPSPAICSEEW